VATGGIQSLSPSRQLRFHQLLVAARKTVLADALSDALTIIEPNVLRSQLAGYVPSDVQQILAAAAIRDEYVFPTTVVLEKRPTLLGYYRLLLGVPQKSFYSSGSGRGLFKSMEQRGVITDTQKALLDQLCKTMSDALAELVRQMSPAISQRDVSELTLLTIGSQFQGGNNVVIGRQAIEALYLSVREVVKACIALAQKDKIVVTNSASRRVTLSFGADPDLRIQEELAAGHVHNKVAIEIKGGTDRSNAHNRAGEAEKSHQKAKAQGFNDFWTIIAKKGLSLETLKSESPSTNRWFDVSQVLGRTGEDWQEFRRRLAVAVGIPLTD
jgi:XcyI restriction endonuclease